jgi:N utilization substance protein A
MRSKIAVYSKNENVDPVGACVGAKGMRVQNVVNELGGEKIEIIHWDEDPAAYVSNALSPAKVLSVRIIEEEKFAQIIVPDFQLSLAIGKEGQNVRLAARLTGWKIDIKSQSQAELLHLLDEEEEDENTEELFDDEADMENMDEEFVQEAQADENDAFVDGE